MADDLQRKEDTPTAKPEMLVNRIIRPLEILLGAIFLLAAALKLQNPNLFVAQIAAYKIFSDINVNAMVAIVTLFTEIFLGTALLLGIRLRAFVPAAVLGMLLFFTGLIAYVWPDDCGCFGGIPMGPKLSIGKNLVMILMGALIFHGARRGLIRPVRMPPLRIAVILLTSTAAAIYTYPRVFQESTRVVPAAAVAPAVPQTSSTPTDVPHPPTGGAYAGYTVETEFGEKINLSKGEFLVASLSMVCEHCMASVPTLNEVAADPAMPRLVALAFEPKKGDKEEFTITTGATFPIQSLGDNFIEFSHLIKDDPPRLALVRDGALVKSWDGDFPPAAELRAAIAAELAK